MVKLEKIHTRTILKKLSLLLMQVVTEKNINKFNIKYKILKKTEEVGANLPIAQVGRTIFFKCQTPIIPVRAYQTKNIKSIK